MPPLARVPLPMPSSHPGGAGGSAEHRHDSLWKENPLLNREIQPNPSRQAGPGSDVRASPAFPFFWLRSLAKGGFLLHGREQRL